LVVGVRLDRLAAAAGASAFPAKLASLARLAKGAGRARLAYLRRHARPATQRGFLLDRARLVVVPVGLEAAARRLCGSGTCEDGPALEAAAGWLRILRETLESDPPRSLAACLDGPPVPLRTDSATPLDAGVTPADPDAAPRKQARAASALQGAAGGGCGVVLLPADKPFAPEDALSALREAGRHAETVRLRFVRAFPPGRQLTAGW
jgi:hypothetical protein